MQSIDHIIDCLNDLHQLKEVVYSQNDDTNPVCHHAKYRSLVLSMLSNLEILDGIDRNGEVVEHGENAENGQMTGELHVSCLELVFKLV